MNNIQILHKENNLYKHPFAEMVHIKKKKENSLNKITNTDSYGNAYSSLALVPIILNNNMDGT